MFIYTFQLCFCLFIFSRNFLRIKFSFFCWVSFWEKRGKVILMLKPSVQNVAMSLINNFVNLFNGDRKCRSAKWRYERRIKWANWEEEREKKLLISGKDGCPIEILLRFRVLTQLFLSRTSEKRGSILISNLLTPIKISCRSNSFKGVAGSVWKKKN